MKARIVSRFGPSLLEASCRKVLHVRCRFFALGYIIKQLQFTLNYELPDIIISKKSIPQPVIYLVHNQPIKKISGKCTGIALLILMNT
ncbi:hypothetical protein BH11BAC4_BH11BAC4_26080 [soil metagenome]